MDTLLGFVLFAALGAVDCDLVRTRTLEDQFESVEAAVRTVARARLTASIADDREWVGGVVRNGDGYFEISEGAGCAGQDTVTFAVPIRRGDELVAFWHTHGRHGPARSYFSRHDAKVVAETGRHFYLMTPDGSLKVLTDDHIRIARARYVGAEVREERSAAFDA